MVRVGGVRAAAVTEFARRIDNGETLRSDGFFDNSNKRSSVEEVIERALVVARDETEERKVALLGRLTAGICFDDTVTREQANNLLRTAERLSYRPLNLLVLFMPTIPRQGFRDASYREVDSWSLELINLLDEMHSLILQGLLNNGPELALTLPDIRPATVTTQVSRRSDFPSRQIVGGPGHRSPRSPVGDAGCRHRLQVS